MKKNAIFVGALAVAIAAILWSLDGTFLRPKLYTLPSPLVVFLEHLLGFIVLTPFLYAYKKQIKKINKKQWMAVFWVALFGGALGTTFITKALFLTGFHDISVVILLQKFQPIFAIILASIFLRERFPKNFYIYAGLAVVAGYFMTFKDPTAINSVANTATAAIIFSLLAAFAWGSATTFGKYSLKDISYGLLTALRFGLTTIIMIIPAVTYFSQLQTVNSTQWWTLITIVFSSGALAMFIYYYGLKKIPASVGTMCELSWPVSAILLDYFLNKNVLSMSQIFGAVIVLLCVTKITMMNRSYILRGKVLLGNGISEITKIPTANLNVQIAKDANLAFGLYTCNIEMEGREFIGLLYYGHNSITNQVCLEVHFKNFDENIYEKTIKVTTQRYLRDQKKFDTVFELAKQMRKDLKSS
ncbi:MAG: EamA family transporter [bacterium]